LRGATRVTLTAAATLTWGTPALHGAGVCGAQGKFCQTGVKGRFGVWAFAASPCDQQGLVWSSGTSAGSGAPPFPSGAAAGGARAAGGLDEARCRPGAAGEGSAAALGLPSPRQQQAEEYVKIPQGVQTPSHASAQLPYTPMQSRFICQPLTIGGPAVSRDHIFPARLGRAAGRACTKNERLVTEAAACASLAFCNLPRSRSTLVKAPGCGSTLNTAFAFTGRAARAPPPRRITPTAP
jgi:hypothetical protein